MENLKMTDRKSKYSMIEMEKALDIMKTIAKEHFPLGIIEKNINGIFNSLIKITT